jgi:hypothetical protein
VSCWSYSKTIGAEGAVGAGTNVAEGAVTNGAEGTVGARTIGAELLEMVLLEQMELF